MGLFSWRQWFSRKVRASRRATPARNNNVRLQLEHLETRLAPTTDLWTGADAGTDNKWNDPKNWSTSNAGGIPVAGDNLLFQSGVSGKGLTSVNNLSSGTVFNQIEFQGSGYTLSGNAITINNTTGGNSILADASTTNNTIALNMQLGGNLGGNATIDVSPLASLTITGNLNTGGNGTGQLNKIGTGTLVLGGDNSSFNGNVADQVGSLEITSATALGNPDGGFTTTVLSQGQLQLSNVGTVEENLNLNGSFTDTTGALLNLAGDNTWSNLSTITLAANTTVGVDPANGSTPSSLTITGLITDNAEGFNLTKEEAGQLILSGVNTYRGQTIINNGILTVENNQALGYTDGTAASGTVVNSNKTESGTLQLDDTSGAGLDIQNEQLVLNGFGFNPSGFFGDNGAELGAVDNSVGNNTWTGNVLLGSPPPNGSDVYVRADASTSGTTTTVSDLLITGTIENATGGSVFNLHKIGSGRVTLEPDSGFGNTYSGSTTVEGGYLRIEDSQALGGNGGKTFFGSGTTVDFGAELELWADPNHVDSVTGAAKMITTGAVTTPKGELQVNQYLVLLGLGISEQGALHSIQGINTWSGTIALASAGSSIGVDADPNESPTNAYLTNDYSLTVTGNFVDGSLTKLDAGQLILPVDNVNWFGNTDIQQGWITVERADSLGGENFAASLTAQPTITIEYGAALHLLAPNDGTLSLPENLVVSGDGISHPFKGDGVNTFGINQAGAVENLEGINTLSGTVKLENNAGIGVEQIFTGAGQNQSKLTLTGELEDNVTSILSHSQGGNGPDEQDFSYNTGAISGTLTVNYSFFGTTPDDLQVLYSGTILKDTTPTTTSGTFTIPYGPGVGNVPPASTTIQVVVNQGGAGANANWFFTIAFTPTVVGGGLDKLGSQELVLQGPGTYTGNVNVKEGVLLDQNSTALGASGVGGVTVDSGAALLLDNSTALENGGLVSGLQVLNKALTLDGAGNSYFLTSGAINPLDATTIYSDGNPATTTSGGSPPTILAPLTVLNGTIVDGSNYQGGDDYWSGPITLSNPSASSVIDVEPNARLTLSGVMGDGAALLTPPAATDLAKIGTGELVLNGSNTYRGTTWINQGFVTLGNSSALGAIPSANAPAIAGGPAGAVVGGTVVAAGASLQLEGDISVAGESLAVQGTGPSATPTVGETWFPLGPAAINSDGLDPGNQAVSGRVTAVVTDPSDPNVIYVGTAGGGVWRTQDDGKTWHPLFDALSLNNPLQVPMNIGAIAISPFSDQTIYIGTGEADTGFTLQGSGVNQRDTYPGTGVYVSNDSGVTWTLLTNSDGSNPILGDDVTSILPDPNNFNTIYVATSNIDNPSAAQGAVWRFDPFNSGEWTNLVNQTDNIRANQAGAHIAAPPNTPGPDDDYRIRFPDSPKDGAQEWSSLAIGQETLHNANGNIIYQGPVLYAALSTPTGNPNFINFSNVSGNVSIPPQGLIVNAVYHTDNFDPFGREGPTPPDSTNNPTSPNWLIGFDTPPSSGNPQTYDQENSTEFPSNISASGGSRVPSNGVIKIAYASSTNTVYAAVAFGDSNSDGSFNGNNGTFEELEESTDGGQTWSAVASPTNYLNNPAYADSIVSTSSGNLYVGGTTATNYVQAFTGSWADISTDTNKNGPFDDIHSMTVDSSNRLVVGTDGGVFRYDPTAGLWTDLNGDLDISLTTHVAVDPTNPNLAIASTHETGAAIDTGSQAWTYVTPGDGSVRIDPITPNVYYSVVGNSLEYSTQSGAPGTWNFFPGQPGNIEYLAPINPNDHTRLVAATAFGVFEYASGKWTNLNGGSISLVAPAVYQGQHVADGLFPDAPDIGSDGYAKNTIYAVSGGQVEVTEDHGAQWVTRSGGIVGVITALTVDPRSSSTAYVVTTTGQVFETTTFGQSWTNITDTGLPSVPVSSPAVLPAISNHSILIDPRNGNVYVGTEEGVYALNSATATWTRFGVGMPLARVTDLVLNETTNTITASTYGRGVFQLTLDDAAANDGGLRAVSGTSGWAGPITLDGNTTIGTDGTQDIQDGYSAASLDLSGVINDKNTSGSSQGYSLTKIGGGTLELAGANTYTGATDIKNGLVIVLNSQALGTGAALGTTVEVGAALQMQSNISGAHLYLNGDGFLVNDHNTGALWANSGAYTYSGPITLESDSTIGVDSGAVLTIANANPAQTSIDDGSGNLFNLTKEGNGILVFSGTNTYHGSTNVNQGVLQITNGSALGGTFPGTFTTVTDGAQLELEAPLDGSGNPIPFKVSNEALVLGGTGLFNTGALLDDRGSDTWAGPITLTSLANPNGFPATQPIQQVAIGVTNAADTLTISGSIKDAPGGGFGTFGLNKVGAGAVILQTKNTFGANSLVTAGALILEDSNALGINNTTTTVDSGAALELEENPSGSDSVTGTANLIVSKSLNLNGSGLSGSPDGALFNASGDNTWNGFITTLKSNSSIGVAANTTLTMTSYITDGGNGYNLTKVDTGTLILDPGPAFGYTGETLVMAGILEIESAQALGTGGTIVSDGATLQLAGGITVGTSRLTLQGSGFNSSTAALDAVGADTWNNTITLTNNSTLGAENNNDSLTVKGIISGGFGLTKIEAGEVDLTAADTYTGTTTIDSGLLLVDGSIAAGASINGGTLGGVGTINGNITATSASGSTLAPGDSSTTVGTLAVKGNVTLNSTSTYSVYLVGSTTAGSGYSQLNVTGTVTLSNAHLTGSVKAGYSPSLGDQFIPIQATNPVTGVFNVFNAGANTVISNDPFDVAYNPTSNPNDPESVVLTRDLAVDTTTLTASPPPSYVYGEPITFTAKVTPEPGYTGVTPTGQIDFYVDGNLVAADPVTLTADSPADGDASASFTYSGLDITHSPHTITATYLGDSNYKSSTSNALNPSITPATPTVTVTADHNPAVTGQSITFTATVAPSPPYSDPLGSLAGTVNFYLGNSATPLNPSPINVTAGSDQAVYTLTASQLLNAAGSTYTITAKFTDSASDGNFKNASGTLTETVNKDATTTTIASTNANAPYGTPTITATVVSDAPGSGNPTGTVTFVAVGSDAGNTTITDPNEPLNGSDVATMTKLLPVLSAGATYTVTANYNGDSNYSTSSTDNSNSNPPLTQTITKATTTVTVATSAASVTYGQNVIFTATVAAGEGTGTPGGTVDLYIDGTLIQSGASLNSNNQAVFTVAALATNDLTVSGSPHTVEAIFNDTDGNYTGNNNTLSGGETVTKASSTVGVAADNNPAVTGQSVTFTATVSPQISGAPSGTVDFVIQGKSGPAIDSGAVTLSGGKATYNTTALVASLSMYTVTVSYSGDSNFNSSSGTLTGNETVNPATPKVSVTGPVTNPVTGQAFTVTAAIDPQFTTGPAPAGTVDFYLGTTLLTTAASGGPITVSGGQASYTFSNGLTADNSPYTIKAVFNDTDGNYTTANNTLSQTINQDSTTTTLAATVNSNPAPSSVDYGTETITATVTPNGTVSGGPSNTDTVTFTAIGSDAAKTTIIDTEHLNGGVATMATLLPVLSGGASYTITATYNGDSNYTTSTSSSLTQTILTAGTAVNVTSSSNPSAFGQTVTFTVTVNPEGRGTPGGTVDIVLDGSTVVSGAKLTNGQATYSTSTLDISGSPHTVVAYFTDTDGNFNSSDNHLTPFNQNVNQANSSVAVTADNTTIVTGQSVTFTAKVSPQFAGSGPPTGTVEFLVQDKNNATVVDDKNVSLSSGVATDSTSLLVASLSAYTVTVNYSGDSNFKSSTGTLTGGETVNKADTTTKVVSSSQNPSTYGQAVTFTATVSVNSPGSATNATPSGTVEFFSGSTQLGAGTFGSGQWTYVTKVGDLPGGADTISAVYEGDGNFNASPSPVPAADTLTQNVNTAATSIGTVTFSFSPTETPPESNPVVGDTITLKVNVSSTASGIGAPTGTVKFYDNNGTTLIGTGTVVSSSGSTATFQGNVATLGAGNHSITAQYVSDGNFSASAMSSPATPVTVTVANTTTTLTPGSSGTEAYGQRAVSVKVTPNSSSVVVPTGNVTFTVKQGATLVTSETDPLDATGSATLQYPLPAGQTYTITASYGGDNNYVGSSTASALSETVVRANTTTAVTGPTGGNTPVTGQSITFTIAVSPKFAGSPQGTAELIITDKNNTQVADVTGISVTNGQGTYTYTPGLSAANAAYNVVAKFTDSDGNFNNSDNTSSPWSQPISKDGTSTMVSSGTPTSTYGASVTFTATVTANPLGSGTPAPGGTVDFFVNGQMVGSNTLNLSDQATFTTSGSQLPTPSDQITATYEGDGNYATSTSQAITQTVNQASTSTGVSISWAGSTNSPPTPPVSGQQITLIATVSGGTVASGSPTGMVNFLDGLIVIGQGTLSDNGDGTATTNAVTVTDLLAGSHTITAKYLSDSNFAISQGTGGVTVDSANTTTTVQTSNANATFGQTPVTATVAVVSPGSGTPTGSVTFTATGGGNTYTDTENLTNGKATMTQDLPVLPAGQSYTITATYNGDNSYSGSAPSKSITQNYSTAGDVVSVISGTDPSSVGQAVTFTAIITPPFTGLPQGTVTFVIDGSTPSDGSGIALLNGKASYTTSGLGAGTHTVSANYTSSDMNFRNNSGVLAGGQTVNGAATPPPAPPASSGGGGGGTSSSSSAPPFNFNYEFSQLETDAIFFAYYNGFAALAGYADPILDAYVNYFLQQIYSNPLIFSASGSYAISLGYTIGTDYFDLSQPTA